MSDSCYELICAHDLSRLSAHTVSITKRRPGSLVITKKYLKVCDYELKFVQSEPVKQGI